MTYELKVLEFIEMAKNLITFEFFSFLFILLFGNQLIKYEFHEYSQSRSRTIRFFDDYNILIYHVYILIHLIADLVMFTMFEQFKKIQR